MAKFHLPSIEGEELGNWKEKRVLQRILERNERPAENPRGNFVFYEGPPTANGKPGIHHVLARVFKDVIIRHRTMQGYRVDRKAGWDTHGLPVELEVEKQLGFTKKQQIEEYGVAPFNRKCRESVWKYVDMFRDLTRRIGFWVDMDDEYVTYSNDYVESLWWILKEVSGRQDRQGRPMLYEGYRTTPHCPRCDTSLSSHELAQGYKDVEDLSVYVKFPVKGRPNAFVLAWTTTPWTLPANLALAVRADIDYAEVELAGSDERFILAESLLGKIDGDYKVVSKVRGEELVGLEYEPLYDLAPADKRDRCYRVYAADFVSTEDGTGVVHIAPAYGDDDAQLGRDHDLPAVQSVSQTGVMGEGLPGAGNWFKDADGDVKADLKQRGLLYKEEQYSHTYPFCWRCGTPLIYLAKASWYIRMSELRSELMANNGQINWVPEHFRDGRFGEWLREAKDWALSRERYWGTPLPVWKCKSCERQHVLGGMEELDEVAPARNTYYFQRHGESNSNTERKITSQDLSDKYHLTERGLEQIETAAAFYKGLGLDAIYSSDLHRTRQTAEAIAQACGLEVTYDERLREVLNEGLLDRSEDDFLALFADADERINKVPEGGESLRQVRLRMVETLKEIDVKHAGQRILVVSHGDALYALKSGLLGYDDQATVDRMKDEYVGTGGHWEHELLRRPYDEEGRIDVHRPYIDEVRLKCSCGGEMRREPYVLDCWFDSGSMPLAQWGYPHVEGSRPRVDGDRPTNYPADYICEAVDQTRGWFYTLLAVSTLLGKGTCYKNVISLGHILDGKGLKMSKSKGNIVDPWEMMDKWGADAIRYHMFTVNQPGEPKRFDEKGLEEVTKKVFLILWNVLSFHQMFAVEGADYTSAPAEPKHPLDRWLLQELNALTVDLTRDLDGYQVVDACRRFGGFVNDLSTWYVRRSRDRFKGEAGERAEASATLGFTLHMLSRLLAPFTPFLAEALYREMGGRLDSVHLDTWPEPFLEAADTKLVTAMRTVRAAASAGLEKRAAAGVPVRQALASATVTAPSAAEVWMSDLLGDELNVLKVEWKRGEQLEVELDTEITPELRRLGLLREIVRNVNALRREAGLTPADTIALSWESSGDLWPETISEHGAALQDSVHATALNRGRTEAGFSTEIDADGQALWLGFSRQSE
ncbi:MAG: class I tRNA ligase family protein [bacterium]